MSEGVAFQVISTERQAHYRELERIYNKQHKKAVERQISLRANRRFPQRPQVVAGILLEELIQSRYFSFLSLKRKKPLFFPCFLFLFHCSS